MGGSAGSPRWQRIFWHKRHKVLDRKLQLTRGAIFTHYEFLQPASNRLNDEQWKKRLKKGKVPPMASWLKSFFVGSVTSKSGVNNFMGGC